MSAADATGAPRRRSAALEWPALQGVMVREVVNFSSFWRSSTFSSTVDPTIYLLAFGFGFGSLVSRVAGYRYIDFVGTGIVATTVLFSGAFPRDVRDLHQVLVPAHLRRDPGRAGRHRGARHRRGAVGGLRTGVYGCVPMLVAVVFGLSPSWGMLLVPCIAALAGYGWASFGIFIAARSSKIESFSYWQSGLLTPMFLVAGTFFPLSKLPEWARILGNVNPLFHCVQLVRHVVFGTESIADLGHLAFLVAFALVSWRLAIRYMERKLII